MQYDAN